jgi:hypothetical protein
MPLSVSNLFWSSLPLILAAIVYQTGPQNVFNFAVDQFVPKIITKILTNLFTTTYCYVSVKTLSSSLPQAECFSVSNGKFSRVFLDDTSYDVIKQARTGHVIPGLWDGHGHLLHYGELMNSANLFGSESMDEVKSRLVEYKAGHEDAGTAEQWLRGVGWDQAKFRGKWPVAVSNT